MEPERQPSGATAETDTDAGNGSGVSLARPLAEVAAELHDRLSADGGCETEPTLPDLPVTRKRAGPYRIEQRLGRGGMGTVFRGYDERLDRPVALKRIRHKPNLSGDARARFRREARAMAQVNHPAVVQVYDWVETESGDWIVMELVHGRPLSRWAGEPLSPELVVPIARQIAAGLAAAHAAGVVHRDLKAANVMLTRDGEIKIVDFGIAKPRATQRDSEHGTETDLTVTGRVVGTASAMSPEQALGHEVDHRADLFSLGLLIYELLTAHAPFRADDPVVSLTRICTVKQPPAHSLADSVPEDLSALVDRMMEKDPARRPQSAGEVVVALDRLGAAAVDASGENPLDDATLIDQATADPPSTEPENTETLSPPVVEAEPAAAARGLHGRRLLVAVALAALALAAVGLLATLRPGANGNADAPAAAEPLTGHELYQRGMAALERYDREGNIDAAIADFQRALERDPDSAVLLAGLSRAYWLDGHAGSIDRSRFDQALAAAERAVAVDEHLAVAHVALGRAQINLGRLDEAEQSFETAATLDPSNPEVYLGFGRIAEARGDLEAAIDGYQEAVERDPEDWFYVSWLATAYLRTADYDEAERLFIRSTELAPDNYMTLRNLGVARYLQGDLSAAANWLQRALEARPSPDLYSNLGTVHFTQGLYPQAVAAFERSLDGGSNNYLMWANLADAYRFSAGRTEEARETYSRAIQLLHELLAAAPRDATLRSRLALYLAKRGDCELAADEIAAVDALEHPEAEARYRLAVAFEVCGRRGEALAQLGSALDAGYSPASVRSDPELLSLRRDAGFHRLMVHRLPEAG